MFDELSNDGTLADVLHVVKTFDGAKEVVLVGHMPSFAEHLAGLLGSENAAALSMGKASVACVEISELRAGHGELRWFLRQKQLRLLVT